MKTFNIHECTGLEYRSPEVGCTKGVGELFCGEHRSEVLWVDSGEAPIPLFGVDIPSSS